jgi:uncharacterized membrane protein YbhN (UPF0104 family)
VRAAEQKRGSDEGSGAAEAKPGLFRRIGVPLIGVTGAAIALFLLYRTLSRYDFDDLVASITAIPPASLALASLFAAASYLTLTGFDYLAVRYAGKPLPYAYVAPASFCSLSLGHNIGFAALSSGAIRYRFYSRAGLTVEEVAKVILFCGMTVGIGLAVLAGIVLLLRPEQAQEITGLSRGLVLALGAASLLGPAIYVLLAATVRRPLRFRRWSIAMPSLKLALGQVVIGPINFAFVAGCLYAVLSAIAEVGYPAVAAVYVLATVATLITHAPGGLGVIESVVVTLLPAADLIGAVLVFRFVYFLVPLSIGGTLLAITELRLRRTRPAEAHGKGMARAS